jgi:hypothetical protein
VMHAHRLVFYARAESKQGCDGPSMQTGNHDCAPLKRRSKQYATALARGHAICCCRGAQRILSTARQDPCGSSIGGRGSAAPRGGIAWASLYANSGVGLRPPMLLRRNAGGPGPAPSLDAGP